MAERAKTEFIRSLTEFGESGDSRWKGEKPFCLYFAQWLKKHPATDKYYDGTGILPYLPELVVEAFDNLREGRG